MVRSPHNVIEESHKRLYTDMVGKDRLRHIILNRTDDSYFESDLNFVWSGSVWTIGAFSDGTIGATGSEWVGFRPLRMRVLSDDPAFELSPRNTDNANILRNDDGGDYAGQWVELNFGGFDLDVISMDDIDAMTEITAIEFQL